MENSNTMKNSLFFKDEIPFAMRKEEASRILSKYPDRIPIIIERSEECSNDIPVVDKKKYLVPNDITTGQFTYIIRKRIELEPSQSLFVTVNGKLVTSTHTLGEIYEKEADKDGFLYMIYTSENTFG